MYLYTYILYKFFFKDPIRNFSSKNENQQYLKQTSTYSMFSNNSKTSIILTVKQLQIKQKLKTAYKLQFTTRHK